MSETTTTTNDRIEILTNLSTDVSDATADEAFRVRTRAFERIYDTLNDIVDVRLPELGPSANLARSESNEDALLELVLDGSLPWMHGAYEPEYYSETWGIHTEYGLQLFFSTCEDVLEDDMTRGDVEEALAETEQRLEEFTGEGYPSDGSKGQAKAAMRYRIKSYQWLLGEYDGELDSVTEE